MALIIHIDTSGTNGIVMLAENGLPLMVKMSEGERDHAGKINLLFEQVLSESGFAISKIDAFVVCNGPGSYTGLRIGLSTAKGLCYALNKPLILHNRLNLMLEEAMNSSPGTNNFLSLIPARVGEYYAAAKGKEINFTPTHFATYSIINSIVKCEAPLQIIGAIHEDLAETVGNHSNSLLPHESLNVETWAKRGYIDFTERHFADLAYSEPEYLKEVFINNRADSKKT